MIAVPKLDKQLLPIVEFPPALLDFVRLNHPGGNAVWIRRRECGGMFWAFL